MYSCKIFLPFCIFFLFLLYRRSWVRCSLLIFFFCCILDDISRKIIAKASVKELFFFTTFSSVKHMVLDLTEVFETFWVNFCEEYELEVQFQCSACVSLVFPAPFVEETVFSALGSWLPCQVSVDCMYWDLTLGCLLHWCLCLFCASTLLFLTLWLCNIVWNRDTSRFVLFSQNCFQYSVFFMIPQAFRIVSSILWRTLLVFWCRLYWFCRWVW